MTVSRILKLRTVRWLAAIHGALALTTVVVGVVGGVHTEVLLLAMLVIALSGVGTTLVAWASEASNRRDRALRAQLGALASDLNAATQAVRGVQASVRDAAAKPIEVLTTLDVSHTAHLEGLERTVRERMDGLAVAVEATRRKVATQAMHAGHPLFFDDWAVADDFAYELMRALSERRPSTVVELGSGASTLLAAHCLKRSGAACRYHSLEHDRVWLDRTAATLREHGVGGHVTLHHAPLRPAPDGPYYDVTCVADVDAIDLLIVDGPPGDTAALARYPAMRHFHARLTAGALILVDDADRPAEREMIARWLTDHPDLTAKFVRTVKGLAVIRKG